MGNRQGAQKPKDPGKTKEEKKREKEQKKEKQKKKRREKKSRKDKSGGLFGSGLDSDLDNSSHVTGGDSESSVFHSAENISESPYLDSCTRSELEQGPGSFGGWGWAGSSPPAAASSVSYYQLHHNQQQQQQPSHHWQQQHPMVLSSRDFRDGFSLEACIPPEIARKEPSFIEEAPFSPSLRGGTFHLSDRDRSGSSIKSKKSHTDSVKSKSSKSSSMAGMTSHHATPTSLRSYGGGGAVVTGGGDDASSMTSSQTSAGGGGAGYSTPLLSTPVFARVERAQSPHTTLTRLQDTPDLSQHGSAPFSSKGKEPRVGDFASYKHSHHHPHFFNHQRYYLQHSYPSQQVQPLHSKTPFQQYEEQRLRQFQLQQLQQQQQQKYHQFLPSPTDFRNLPKPTSPHPQRRALSPKMTSAPFKLISSDDSSSSPTTPVPQRRANILDIFRSSSKLVGDKGEKKTKQSPRGTGGGARGKYGGKSDSGSSYNEPTETKSRSKWKTWERSSTKKKFGDKQSKVSMIFGTVRKSDKKKPSCESDRKSKVEGKGGNVEKDKNRKDTKNGDKLSKNSPEMSVSQSVSSSFQNKNSSPPIAKSAAFCIMKLEELERNIEKTIREKFPHAEPLLLKRRTKDEELKGSRSLPTTPSLKKKLYVAQHANSGTSAEEPEAEKSIVSNLRAVSSKLSDKGTTRWCQETFVESPPSPAMSPVVLRRFGARTRHASISPKIQRAKTAALYNSPSEMRRVDEACSAEGRTVTTKVPQYRAVSRGQEKASQSGMSPLIATSLAIKPKSSSKYDNVNDESDEDRRRRVTRTYSQLTRQKCVDEDDSDEVEETYDNMQHNQNQKPVIVPTFSAVFGSVSPKLKRHLESKFKDAKKTHPNEISIGQRTDHPDVRSSSLRNAPTSNRVEGTHAAECRPEPIPLSGARTGKSDAVKVSVKERVKSINKSLSEGWSSESAGGNQNQSNTQVCRSLPVGRETTTRSSTKSQTTDRVASPPGSPLDEWHSASYPQHHSPLSQLSPFSPLARLSPSSPSPFAQLSPSSPPPSCSSGSYLESRLVASSGMCSPGRAVVTSPGSSRKHSIDHVVFGSAVALPCRLYASRQQQQPTSPSQPLSPHPHASSSSQEETHVVNSSSPEHTSRDPLRPALSPPQCLATQQHREGGKNAKKQKTSGEERNDTADLATFSQAVNRPEAFRANASLDGESPRIGGTSSEEPFAVDNDFTEFTQDGCLDKRPDGKSVLTVSTPHSLDGGSVSESDSRNEESPQAYVLSSPCISRESNVNNDCVSTTTSSGSKTIRISSLVDESDSDSSTQCDARKKQLRYIPEFKEDTVQISPPVFRQPISQVICDMINTSKTRDNKVPNEDQSAHSPKSTDRRLLHQSSPTSPDQEKHVEHVVTMVTSQTYEQPFRTLEEKTVRSSEGSVSLPSSPIGVNVPSVNRIQRDFGNPEISASRDVSESKSAGSQTDSVSTAEKGVESSDLPTYTSTVMDSHARPSNLTTTTGSDIDNSKGDKSGSDKSENSSEFLRRVEASGETCKSRTTRNKMSPRHEKEAADTSSSVESPPPPSPSVRNQLLEEFGEEEEEDDGDEVNERYGMEKSLTKDPEMREFTDRVFTRLSSLLSNNDGDVVEVDDEVFDDDCVIGDSKDVAQGGAKVIAVDEEAEDDGEDDESVDEDFEQGLDESRQDTCYKEGISTVMTLSQTSEGLKRVLTIPSSSSSITTTTESSDGDEDFMIATGLQQTQVYPDNTCESHDKEATNLPRTLIENAEGAPKKKTGDNYFVFPEFNEDRRDLDVEEAKLAQRKSRDCHSDDDVARGQGIPDYYDDRPLWRRRQIPPGQLSLQMVAIRRRERRERWLKKRQRNRTDLLSTGSSDTGSESSLLRLEHPRLKDPSSAIDYSYYDQSSAMASEPRQAMGSGILSSPKYSKPIMPFFSGRGGGDTVHDRAEGDQPAQEELIQATVLSARLQAAGPPREVEDSSDRSGEALTWSRGRKRDSFDHGLSSDDDDEASGRTKERDDEQNLVIPGIEETFHELESVKHILEGLQDRTVVKKSTKKPNTKCMPLTTENVKSVSELYQGNEATVSAPKSGRRSRMSMTDRTESDLDIYSEAHDDASTDSNVYADDEGDDDGADTYTTADDDVATTAGSGSDTLGRRNGGKRHHGNDQEDYDYDENDDFVMSYTFYNSNAQPQSKDSEGGVTPVPEASTIGSSGKTTPQNSSKAGAATASQASSVEASVLNSDEEFWSGSAAIEASYKQMETAADAVSSTFQNAREQMIDIQQHLQTLRRQMAGMEDDMTTSASAEREHDLL